jgi:hypothetical protein
LDKNSFESKMRISKENAMAIVGRKKKKNQKKNKSARTIITTTTSSSAATGPIAAAPRLRVKL